MDTINGFIEVYMDARGVKGAWEALVYYVNPRRPRSIQSWRPTRSGSRTTCRGPRATASRGAGRHGAGDRGGHRDRRLGPVTPIGINLPNDQRIREQHGSKSVSLSNVIEAYDKSTPGASARSSPGRSEEAERARSSGARRRRA